MAKSGIGGATGEATESSPAATGTQAAAPSGAQASNAAPKAAKSEEKSQGRSLACPETGKVTVQSVARGLAECCRTRPMTPEVAQEAKRIGSTLHRQAGGTSPELGEAVRKFYAEPTAENGEAVAKIADQLAASK